MSLLVAHLLTIIVSIFSLVAVSVAGAYGQSSKADSLLRAIDQVSDGMAKAQLQLELFKEQAWEEESESPNLALLDQVIQQAQQEKLTALLTEAYLEKAYYYHYIQKSEKDSVYYFLSKSLEVSQQYEYRKLMPQILFHLGNFFLFSRRDQVDSALYYYSQSLEANEPTIDTLYKEKVIGDMAIYYYVIGDHQKGLDYSLQAIALDPDDPVALNTAGICLDNLGRYAEAIEYYLKGLKITKGEDSWEPVFLINLGRSYNLQKEYEKALPYLHEAKETFRKNNSHHLVITLEYLGLSLTELGQYDEAIDYYQEAIEFAEQYNYTDDLFMPTNGLGKTYAIVNELDSARKYLNLALDYATTVKEENYRLSSRIELGKLDILEGLTRQGIARLTSVREDALKADRKDYIIDVDEALYEAYKQQGNYQQALFHHEEFKAYSDSVFNKESTAQIARLESQHEFDQEKQQLEFDKQQELAKKDSQLQRQRTFQIATAAALLVALVVVLIIIRYYRLKQRANRELTKLNEEVQGQKRQLEELNQVKSRFFTNISHELRTPLTIIGGMTRHIEKKPDQWLAPGLQMIQRNSDQLLNLVNQILDLRKLESGTLKLDLIQGDIIFYLRYIVESFHSLAESQQIELHFRSQPQQLLMDYDPEKLLRVVSNLLSNAIKFTPEAGQVYLRVATEPGKNSRTDETAASELVLTVEDTGVGISEEKLPYIFDRFYQVDDSSTRASEGTGVGLALAKELVRLMGGEITVASQVGEGTSFRITLPIRQQAPVAPTVSPETLPQAPLSSPLSEPVLLSPVEDSEVTNEPEKPRLLIIEDNADVVSYLQVLLEGRYELLIATDGAEGIEMALEHIPDLILSDVMMPKKDGFAVCATLKQDERTSHIPIVLLTAKADVDSRIAGLKRGADAYLAKPFHQEELFARLEQLHQLRRQLQARYASLEVQPLESTDEVEAHFEDAFMAQLRQKIEEYQDNSDFGIAALCTALGMSRSQLHLKIKALTARSTSHFIRGIRLQRANALLEQSELNISEVAYEVGFQDPAYFSRTFTQEFGVSPTSFLKAKV
ncbi:MAG: ATP-binding protein [Cyclobacteriaceae bacterium]